ncbi:MAG: vanadium-dependent haloperoxidase [Symploca sp. SIO2E6]|nr:vanadium-dependent haloperoxidase [Symploca sp. SIO2E6]
MRRHLLSNAQTRIKASLLPSALVVTTLLFSSPARAQTAIADIPLDPNKQSVASQWISEALLAVSTPTGSALGPTGASRAYGMLGTAMYDAWSAYELLPSSTVLGDTLQQLDSDNTSSNKAEAVSYAAFTVLSDLFPEPTLVDSFRNRMTALGFDPDHAHTTSANIGQTMANALLDFRHNDGSNQLGDNPNSNGNPYSGTSGYVATNSANNLPNSITSLERWTPENVPIDSPPGDPNHQRIQSALTPHWGNITPFSLSSGGQFRPSAPEAFLLDPNATADLAAGTITRSDNTTVEISKDLIGVDINPAFIAQAEEVVEYSASLSSPEADSLPGGQAEGDRRKLIAEFWEDPSGTPFPPGTWMFFGQKVAEKDNPDLDNDIPLFFNLGNAVFDAGIATWEAKYYYDYVRPVRAIRELGRLCLIGTENANGDCEIRAWAGPGQGTQTILATDFLTYQTPGGDPSPPFPEYTSGHSAFSAAAAEVLRQYTGSDDFILGDGTLGLGVTFGPGDSRFEPGLTPQSDITLSWSTFSEAADEAGLSRLYGGIHFDDGDINGRILGRQVGNEVFARTQYYLNGAQSVPEPGVTTALLALGGSFVIRRWGRRKS